MKEFDAIFLGEGPTAPTVLDFYLKKTGGKGRYLLITEQEDPRGAVTKGVKVVNPIIPKLPNIQEKNFDNYQQTIKLVRASEAALERIFQRTSAFIGESELSFRYCINQQEFDVLNAIPGFLSTVDSSVMNSTGEFIQNRLGYPVDRARLFPFKEKIWNVNEFMKIAIGRIPFLIRLAAKRVEFESEYNNGVILRIQNRDGNVEKVYTEKLIVCKGIGNVTFENDIKLKTALMKSNFNFNILEFSKFIYDGEEQMPQSVSSIMIPEHGICVTNEQEQMHSLLYNTGSRFLSADVYDPAGLNEDMSAIRRELADKHPKLSASCADQFRCAMTVVQKAYIDDLEKHFRFVFSPSVIANITYVNLPYFTVIGTAVNYLPNKIIDLK